MPCTYTNPLFSLSNFLPFFLLFRFLSARGPRHDNVTAAILSYVVSHLHEGTGKLRKPCADTVISHLTESVLSLQSLKVSLPQSRSLFWCAGHKTAVTHRSTNHVPNAVNFHNQVFTHYIKYKKCRLKLILKNSRLFATWLYKNERKMQTVNIWENWYLKFFKIYEKCKLQILKTREKFNLQIILENLIKLHIANFKNLRKFRIENVENLRKLKIVENLKFLELEKIANFYNLKKFPNLDHSRKLQKKKSHLDD